MTGQPFNENTPLGSVATRLEARGLYLSALRRVSDGRWYARLSRPSPLRIPNCIGATASTPWEALNKAVGLA